MMKERVWLLRTTAARLVDRAAMLETAGSACALGCVVALNEMRRFLTTYPVDFYRRAQQKWVRRLQSLRMPVGALEAYLDSALKGGTETSG